MLDDFFVNRNLEFKSCNVHARAGQRTLVATHVPSEEDLAAIGNAVRVRIVFLVHRVFTANHAGLSAHVVAKVRVVVRLVAQVHLRRRDERGVAAAERVEVRCGKLFALDGIDNALAHAEFLEVGNRDGAVLDGLEDRLRRRVLGEARGDDGVDAVRDARVDEFVERLLVLVGQQRAAGEVLGSNQAFLDGVQHGIANTVGATQPVVLDVFNQLLGRFGHGHLGDGRVERAAVHELVDKVIEFGNVFLRLVADERTDVEAYEVTLHAEVAGNLFYALVLFGHEFRNRRGIATNDGVARVEAYEARTRDSHFLFTGDAHPRVILVGPVQREVLRGGAGTRREADEVAHGRNHLADGRTDEDDAHLVGVFGRLGIRLDRIGRCIGTDAGVLEHIRKVLLDGVGDGFAEGNREDMVRTIGNGLHGRLDNRIHAVAHGFVADGKVVVPAAFLVSDVRCHVAGEHAGVGAGKHEATESAGLVLLAGAGGKLEGLAGEGLHLLFRVVFAEVHLQAGQDVLRVERLVPGNVETVAASVAVTVVERSELHVRDRRFIEYEFCPDGRRGRGALDLQRGVSNGAVSHHVELRALGGGIERHLADGVAIFVEDADERVRYREIQDLVVVGDFGPVFFELHVDFVHFVSPAAELQRIAADFLAVDLALGFVGEDDGRYVVLRHDEVDGGRLGRVVLEGNSQGVVAGAECILFHNLRGVDFHVCGARVDGDAFVPGAHAECFAVLAEVAAEEQEVGRAFHGIDNRAFVAREVTGESVFLDDFPDVPILDAVDLATGEEDARFGVQVHGGTHHEVRG